MSITTATIPVKTGIVPFARTMTLLNGLKGIRK